MSATDRSIVRGTAGSTRQRPTRSKDRKRRFRGDEPAELPPQPGNGKEVAVTLFRRTFGGQEESKKGSSQEEGSQEEDREEEVALSFWHRQGSVPQKLRPEN